MRSADELQRDQDRLAICAELEKALASVERTFPGLTMNWRFRAAKAAARWRCSDDE